MHRVEDMLVEIQREFDRLKLLVKPIEAQFTRHNSLDRVGNVCNRIPIMGETFYLDADGSAVLNTVSVAGGSYKSLFRGASQAADLAYTLPSAYPDVSGKVLSCTSEGVMSWVSQGSGSVGLRDLSDVVDSWTSIGNKHVLLYNSTSALWENKDLASEVRGLISGSSPISYNSSTGQISLTQSGVDHGSIGGLGDDDHAQYYNQTRGDARYSLLSHNHGTGTKDYIPMWSNTTGGLTDSPMAVFGANVGIGTTQPGGKLSFGSYVVNTDNPDYYQQTAHIRLYEGGSVFSGFSCSTGALNVAAGSSMGLRFYTDSVERARMDTTGRLGIGTKEPGALLEVNGTSKFVGRMDMSNYTVADAKSVIIGTPWSDLSLDVFKSGEAATASLYGSDGILHLSRNASSGWALVTYGVDYPDTLFTGVLWANGLFEGSTDYVIKDYVNDLALFAVTLGPCNQKITLGAPLYMSDNDIYGIAVARFKYATITSNASGQIAIKDVNASVAADLSANNLIAGGRVGAGVASPGYAVQANGDIVATGGSGTGSDKYLGLFKSTGAIPGLPNDSIPCIKSDSAIMYLSLGGYQTGYFHAGSGNSYLVMNGANAIPKVRFDCGSGNSYVAGTGNFGIGPGAKTPATRLDVDGSATIHGNLYLVNNNLNNLNYIYWNNRDGSDSPTGSNLMWFESDDHGSGEFVALCCRTFNGMLLKLVFDEQGNIRVEFT